MRFFFFFSSRRRHTRCYRDWSSDVCSSDLGPSGPGHVRPEPPPPAGPGRNRGARPAVIGLATAGRLVGGGKFGVRGGGGLVAAIRAEARPGPAGGGAALALPYLMLAHLMLAHLMLAGLVLANQGHGPVR